MDKLLKLLVTFPVVRRFIRNTVASLVVSLSLAADHHMGWAHVGLSIAVGALTALFKAFRDAFPTSKLLEYLPL